MSTRHPHSFLLASLMLLLVAYPFVGEGQLGDWILRGVLVVTMMGTVYFGAENWHELAIGAFLVVSQQLVDLFVVRGPVVDNVTSAALGFAVFAYATVLMLRRIFGRTDRVTTDTIAGALAIYLLLGVAWSFAFTLLELAEPGSFAVGGEPVQANIERFLGFSFVTLTTLGYGNIVPTTPRADAMCVAESILGQVYLTVLVARLVALHMAHSRS